MSNIKPSILSDDQQNEKFCKQRFNLDLENSQHFYHLCSKGTKTDLLFHNEEQFVSGMNAVALAAASSPAKILAFCLMDNHFHFILSGNLTEIHQFRNKIHQLYFRRRSIFDVSLSEKIEWSIFLVSDMTYLQHAIAYVLSNPINAYYKYMPTDYPWSSAGVYFNPQTARLFYQDLSEISVRDQRKLLRSQTVLPQDWKITSMGFIWPGSYVERQLVEFIYKTPRSFLYHLVIRNENNLAAQDIIKNQTSLPDMEIMQFAKKECRANFGHENIKSLTQDQRLRIALALMKKYNISQRQSFRITCLQIR